MKKLFRNEFFKNFSLLASGTILAQLVGIAITPVLSRIYSEQDFGEYAIYLACIEVLVILSTLRYELGIVVCKNEQQALALLKGANLINLTFSAGLLILIAIVHIIDNLYLHKDIIRLYYYIIPFGLFGGGILLIQTNFFNRRKEYSKLSLLRLVQSIIYSLLALLIGLFFRFQYALVVSAAVAVMVISIIVLYQNKGRFSKVSLKYLGLVLRRNYEFPKVSVPGALMDTFTGQMPVFFITTFFGKGMTGLYSQAFRLISLPLRIVGQSIAQLFFQRLSEIVNSGKDPRKFILRNWLLLAAVGFIPCTIVFFFGPDIFGYILGEEWRQSGYISSILAPFLYISFISQPTSTAFIVFNSQRTLLWFTLSSCFYRPLAFIIGYYQNDVYLAIKLFVWMEIAQIVLFNIFLWKRASNISS